MGLKTKHFGAYLLAGSIGAITMLFGAPVFADDDDDDDDKIQSLTITDIVAQSGTYDRNGRDYDILLQAVLAAGLADALADPQADLTVFAPNDRAFIRLAQDLGYAGHDEQGAFEAIAGVLTSLSEDGNPIPLLTNVLLYHVSPEAKKLREIRRTDVIDTLLDGAPIVPVRTRLLDADPDFKNPRLLRYASNIKASNGIIHTVDRVLIPADLPNTDPNAGTIVDIVLQSGGDFDRNWRDYDLLLNAVIAADLVGVLADPGADFTVFAPTDAAFIRLARALGYRGFREDRAFDFIVAALTDLGGGDPIPLLTGILLYHVSPSTQVARDVILADTIFTAFDDATIHPDGTTLEDNASALRDPKLNIYRSDIRASNGIIHTINRVLIPIEIGH